MASFACSIFGDGYLIAFDTQTRRSGADIPSVLPLHLCSALVLPLSGTHNQVRTSPAKSAIDTVFSSQVQALSVRAPPTAIPLGLQNSKYTKSVSNVQNTSGGGDHWEHALTAVTVPTFSFSATVTLLSGRNVHGMLKTALHVVNDVMMSSGVKLFTDPKSVVVVFEPAASPVGNDRRHLQSVNNNLQIAGAKVERCSLLDALCMLGLTSLPASGWDEATSTEAVLNASLHLGQASLLRKALLTPMHAVEVALSNAVGKSHRSSYGAEEGQNALQSVKTVHSWAVLVQKTLLEGSLVALLRSEVIPILLGKMPTRAAPLDSSYVPGSAVPQQQFSTDIPGPLTAALQETFCTAQGLACLIDGLHNRKAAELSHALALTAHSKPSSLIGRQGWARTPTNLRSAPAILELESALAELQRQKRELHCIAQIVSVVIIILEWRGLSFYPLLQGYKAVQDYRMKQHAAAVATFNGEHLALPDKPNSTESAKAGSSNGPFGTQQHATQLLVSKSTFAVLSSTYEDLLSTLVGKLEPELRCIADLSSISHDARPVERILALFMLPLTNLRSVCGKMLAKEHQQDSASMNMDDGEVHASSMDTTNGESLPSVDDAADIGHCIVQYVVMDMILLSTAPAFATGAMARAGCSQSQAHHSNRHGINTNVTHLVKAAELEAGRIALDTFPVLAAQLSAAACLPHQLAQASLCLWRIDASIDVTDAVYSIHCAHPMVSDASLVVAIAKRLLVTGKLECARAFFVQLANNPGLQTPFGAVATACAIPSVDSWPIVWHDARRRCDAIAVTNTVEANAARAAIARHVAIWAINMGELGAVLESKLTSIEESAIHDMLLARWEMELVEVGNQHVFHDILLAWYLHRDMHEDARQLMRRFSDQHGMQGEEENPDGAGVFAPTLMRAFEDVFAT